MGYSKILLGSHREMVAANKEAAEPRVLNVKVEVIDSKGYEGPHGYNACVTHDHGYVMFVVYIVNSYPLFMIFYRIFNMSGEGNATLPVYLSSPSF